MLHIDDVTPKIDLTSFYNHITGDFEIRKRGVVEVIPAKDKPKMVFCSNYPIGNDDPSTIHRQFLVEVGNYYNVMLDEWCLTPFDLHGHKHFPTPGHEEEWNETDYSHFYQYVFSCISLYLKEGGLPSQKGGSDDHRRHKLLQEIGCEVLLDFFLKRLGDAVESGCEDFCEVLYRDARDASPEGTADVTDQKLWEWFVSAGKFSKMLPNQKLRGKTEQVRMTPERMDRWIAAGMEETPDKNGNLKGQGDRVKVFKVSSLRKPKTMFSKPDFSHQEPAPTQQQQLPNGDDVVTSLEELMG